MDGVVGKVPTGAFYYMVKLPVKDACDFIEWLITDFDYQRNRAAVPQPMISISIPGMGWTRCVWPMCWAKRICARR